MDIRPQDLPELRAEALLWQAANGDKMLTRWSELGVDYGALSPAEFARQAWRYEMERLGSATLFYITRPMVQLALVAAESLPDFRISPEDLPALTGLMVFEEPLPFGIHWDDGDVSRTRALLWSISDRLMAVGGLLVTTYVDKEEFARTISGPEGTRFHGPGLIAMTGSTFTSGFADESWTKENLKKAADRMECVTSGQLLPALLAAWLLMQQPLTLEVEVESDRAARKRLRRAGQEPKPVRVIELRRPKGNSEKGDGSREYRHQWITRGHWRQHWYPKRQVHRPVWIAPHVKGPEGAPLIGGEKVYAWKR
ncbi:hypothetical protein [Streptomyces sp. YPW6]|uniref:hypothetical protein n=1 Tax=Streptomyces sp. YPW6 TaxID=2840373 RepID=UPI003D72CBAE